VGFHVILGEELNLTSTNGGYAGSVQAKRVSEGADAPPALIACTKIMYFVLGWRSRSVYVVAVVSAREKLADVDAL